MTDAFLLEPISPEPGWGQTGETVHEKKNRKTSRMRIQHDAKIFINFLDIISHPDKTEF